VTNTHAPQETSSPLADDRLVGVNAIAAYRGETPRRTRYLIEIGELPVGKEGNIYVASKRGLDEDWRRKTCSAADPKAA